MKFSILIPTKNGLDYLSYATQSVLKQNYRDWEIIISDNCSNQNIQGLIKSLNDDRIKYFRVDKPVSVTENWNNALNNSTGDWVVMLGDDDSLMPNYFSKVIGYLCAQPLADCLYYSCLKYTYPNILKNQNKALIRIQTTGFIPLEKNDHFIVPFEVRKNLVQMFMQFKLDYCLNAQFFLISRKLIQEIISTTGQFYKSPAPDYYSTNSMMLKSRCFMAVKEPLAIIGICPKSTGYYHLNSKPERVLAILNNDDVRMENKLSGVVLPGVLDDKYWLFSAEYIYENYGKKYNLRVDYSRYRFIQIGALLKYYYIDKRFGYKKLRLLAQQLSYKEKYVYYWPMALIFIIINILPEVVKTRIVTTIRRIKRQQPNIPDNAKEVNEQNILEVYYKVEREGLKF